jgi:hypothetical protein
MAAIARKQNMMFGKIIVPNAIVPEDHGLPIVVRIQLTLE